VTSPDGFSPIVPAPKNTPDTVGVSLTLLPAIVLSSRSETAVSKWAYDVYPTNETPFGTKFPQLFLTGVTSDMYLPITFPDTATFRVVFHCWKVGGSIPIATFNGNLPTNTINTGNYYQFSYVVSRGSGTPGASTNLAVSIRASSGLMYLIAVTTPLRGDLSFDYLSFGAPFSYPPKPSYASKMSEFSTIGFKPITPTILNNEGFYINCITKGLCYISWGSGLRYSTAVVSDPFYLDSTTGNPAAVTLNIIKATAETFWSSGYSEVLKAT